MTGVALLDRSFDQASAPESCGESRLPATSVTQNAGCHEFCGLAYLALAWVHKTANVLNKVALSVQVNMKADLREIYGASTRAAAEAAIDVFADKYSGKYDKAVDCLTKDRDALLAFFDFPAEHWDHLRTSNPIESVFATVRHRTVRTKGALSAKTAKLMVFKLVNAAAKTWRRLKGENQLPKVVQGVKFKNGIEVTEMPAYHAA
jgi:putative transposase